VVSTGPVRVEVPDVIGLPQADAQTTITGAGLVAGTVTTQNSDTVAAGAVISQDPFGGLLVTLGSAVDLLVSLGPQTTVVPDVVGLAQASAESAITAVALTVGAVTTQNHATVPAGDVINQNPNGGTVVVLGTSVDIVVSLGQVTFPAPNLVGLSGTDAQAAIVAAGFVVGAITEQFSTTVTLGDVINQIPGVGSPLLPGMTIALVLSLGAQQVQVPDVVSLPQAQAEAAIIAGELAVGVVTTQNSLTVPAGAVISQDPVAGTTVDAASSVNIVVSLGPRQIQVPDVVGDAQAVAEAAITGAGLMVGAITEQISLTQLPGTVLNQTPIGGTTVDEQSAVDLSVATADTTGALINIVLDPPAVGPNEPVLVTIEAADNSGVAPTVNVTIDGVPFPLDANNQGIFSSPTPGSYEVIATAIDGSGNESQNTDAIQVSDPSDTTPPVAILTGPTDLAEITLVADLVGTASDDNLKRYQLGLRRVSDATFTIFAAGTTNVVAEKLAELDATMLTNGIYKVRLVVEDLNGQTAIDERTYVIGGEAKPGIFQIGFTDLAVPVTGIPIAIERIYDNRVKSSEDFGFGWTMRIRQGSYEHNRTPGLGWQILPSSGFLSLPCRDVQETASHMTEVRLSDREWYRFRLKVTSNGQIGGGCDVTIGFDFLDGSTPGATLAILDGTSGFYPNGANEIQNFDPGSDDFLKPVNPKRVRLTTYDGRMYDLDANFGGITRLEDPNGNTMTISDAGLMHSAGLGVSFTRDGQNRVTEIIDPRGNSLNYVYDAAGNLVSFFDQAGNETTFEYDGLRNLLAINDPLGNRANTNEYDTAGRLIATTDANGNRIEFTRNLAGREEVIVNARGAITRLLYDEDGNVVSRERSVTIEGVQVLATTTLEYDVNGNETVITNPDGEQTEQSFNAQNLMLSQVIDPGGLNITHLRNYNASGDMLTNTDPNGLTQSYTYDGPGNPTVWQDRDGFAVNLTYDSQGNLTGKTDDAGNTRSASYSSTGLVVEEVDALGYRTTYTYDVNGNRTSETVFRTIGGVLTPLVTTREYDEINNITRIVDPDGNETRFEYNALGLRSAMIDPLGRRTEFSYDLTGALVQTRFADGTSESQTYDSSGNIISRMNRAGNTTQFEYDELDNLVRTIFADGSDVRTVYTPGGRQAATIDANGNRTNFDYDAAGRLITVRLPGIADAVGGGMISPIMQFEYDVGSRRTAQIDPLGNRTEFAYDVPGGRVIVTNPDGTVGIAQFDHMARMVSTTNEDGVVTLFGYEGESPDRLTSVQLPSPDGVSAGPVTLYTYDEAGNRLSQSDALGRVTTFAYDNLNRISEVIIPGGQSRSLDYDAVSNLISETDFDGVSVTYEYDSMNRLMRKNIPGGSAVAYRYTATGQRDEVEDNRGITAYAYDSRDRLISVNQPDTGEIQYEYDAAGNLTRMTSPNGVADYTYDALNRLADVSADGDVITYGYDAGSRIARVTMPNNIVTEYEFDSRGRPASIVFKNPLGDVLESYDYDYTPGGRTERVAEFDGSMVTFGYDGIGRLTGETRTGSSSYVRSHMYDLVGNRSNTIVDGVATNFTYDVNDQLVSANTTSFAYDLKGNMVERSGPGGTVNYGWTPENRLAEVNNGINVTTFGYDADGQRISRQTGAETTRFLIDGQNPTGFTQVLEETNDSGMLLSEYQYGSKLAAANVAGDRRFYHDDALRDTRLLTDSTGAVTDSYDYSAYGELVTSTGSTDQSNLYNGEQLDPAADSYYLRQRYYDPGIGRFLSRDQFSGVPRLPMSLNPYLYGDSDPVSYYDPSGNFTLMGVSIGLSISGVLRGINITQKSTTMCRIKSRLKIFEAVWALRSIGQYFATSNEYGATSQAQAAGAGGSAIAGKVTLYSAAFPRKYSLEEVTLETKYPAAHKVVFELAAKMKLSSAPSATNATSGSAKVIATKDLNTGKYDFDGAVEAELEVAKIKFCGIVTVGTVFVGGEVQAGTSDASASGYFKLATFGVASWKFTVVKF